MSKFHDDILGVILVKINQIAIRTYFFIQEY